MKVREIMHHDVRTLPIDSSLADAARLMWDCDCGALPIVDRSNKPIAMITDRDICMAALHSDAPLSARGVIVAMSKQIFTINREASITELERVMQRHQIRRVPVVESGGAIVGIVTLADVARHAHAQLAPVGAPAVTRTLASIVERRWEGPLAHAAE